MIHMRKESMASLLVVSWALAGSLAAAQRQPHDALKKHAGFTDAELRDMEQGQVVSKILEVEDATEVAVIGAVWIEASPEEFVARQKDIENLEKGDQVLAIKKLSVPPKLSDFATLEFPAADLDDLATCKIGDCPVKIDAPALLRIQSEIDWSAKDAHQQANRLIQRLAFEGIEAYLKGGDASLGAYRDKKRPLFLEKEFKILLQNSPYIIEYDPDFHAYLEKFPNVELEGREEYFYWSKVQFGLKPTVRLSHVVIYPIDEPGLNTQYVIGSKMLYASHYFHTGLELKYLSRDTAKPDAKGFYLVSVNRSRSDGLTGFFGGIIRSRAQSGARDGLRGALENAKTEFESAAGQE